MTELITGRFFELVAYEKLIVDTMRRLYEAEPDLLAQEIAAGEAVEAARWAVLPHDRKGTLAALRALDGADREADHVRADRLLLALIDDPEITATFNALDRWYG